MDEQRINQLLMAYADKLPPVSIESLKNRVMYRRMDEQSLQLLLMQMKDPTISIILSILVGTVGVDRFYIGDVGMGIGKLLTGGGCGVWWLIDIFLIMDATRQKNLETLMLHLA
ncbi:MAG: TM2 domain-containing protein [Prevotella sp.]|nr:TM2 domain-containing protein [Prevotella sp.]